MFTDLGTGCYKTYLVEVANGRSLAGMERPKGIFRRRCDVCFVVRSSTSTLSADAEGRRSPEHLDYGQPRHDQKILFDEIKQERLDELAPHSMGICETQQKSLCVRGGKVADVTIYDPFCNGIEIFLK